MSDTPLSDRAWELVEDIHGSGNIFEFIEEIERRANAMAAALTLLNNCGHPCGTALESWLAFVAESRVVLGESLQQVEP